MYAGVKQEHLERIVYYFGTWAEYFWRKEKRYRIRYKSENLIRSAHID